MNNNLTEPYVSAGQLNIPAGLFFTRQPQRASASGPDQTAVFSVTAIGAVSYQWQYNDGSGWTDIDGAESDTFETVIGPGMHGWKFRCIVEDADGASAASAAAYVTVTNTSEITLSGPIASIDYGPVNIKALLVDINPVQAGTGDPSPENERPISGWDAVNAVRTVFNQWDEEWEVGGYQTSNGNPSAVTDRIRSKQDNYIPIVPSTTYYSCCSAQLTICYYDADKTFLEYAFVSANRVFTTPSSAQYMRFAVATGYGTTYNNDISINYPSTDTAYHKYNGTTYHITLPDTVYGGKLEIVSGVMTINNGIRNLGDDNWYPYTAQNGFSATFEGLGSNSFADGACTHFKILRSAAAMVNEMGIVIGAGNSYLYACHITDNMPDITDGASFKSWLATNNVKLVYPLATPQTITLTPTEVSTVLGYNNIFADSGEVEVIYKGWPNAEPESVGLGSLNPNIIQDVFTPDVIEDVPQTLDVTPEFDTLL